MIDAPKTEINLISTTATVTVLDPFQISKILNISWYCISKNLRGINCSPSRRRNDIDRVVPNYTMTYDIHIWLLIKTCYSVLKLKTQHNKDWQWVRSIGKPRVNPLLSYWWRNGIGILLVTIYVRLFDLLQFIIYVRLITNICSVDSWLFDVIKFMLDCMFDLLQLMFNKKQFYICLLTVRFNTLYILCPTNHKYMFRWSLTVRFNTFYVRLITIYMFVYDRLFHSIADKLPHAFFFNFKFPKQLFNNIIIYFCRNKFWGKNGVF